MFCREGETLDRTQQHPYRFHAGCIAEINASIVRSNCRALKHDLGVGVGEGGEEKKKENQPAYECDVTCPPFFRRAAAQCLYCVFWRQLSEWDVLGFPTFPGLLPRQAAFCVTNCPAADARTSKAARVNGSDVISPAPKPRFPQSVGFS